MMRQRHCTRSAQRKRQLTELLSRFCDGHKPELYVPALVTLMRIPIAQAKALVEGTVAFSEASLRELAERIATVEHLLSVRVVGLAKVPKGTSLEEAQKLYEQGSVEVVKFPPMSLSAFATRKPR